MTGRFIVLSILREVFFEPVTQGFPFLHRPVITFDVKVRTKLAEFIHPIFQNRNWNNDQMRKCIFVRICVERCLVFQIRQERNRLNSLALTKTGDEARKKESVISKMEQQRSKTKGSRRTRLTFRPKTIQTYQTHLVC